jgi:hypothetical protein
MANGKWGQSLKGKANRVFNKVRDRAEAKGFTWNVKPDDFYAIWFRSDTCWICGKPFSALYGKLKSIRLVNLGTSKVVKPENISVVHYSCNKLGNQNARKN